jgi:hypothetical protein
MLWDDSFYESGEDCATRIAKLIPEVQPAQVATIAVEAREKMKLRHVPLLLCREMLRHPQHRLLVAKTLYQVIQRPDELSEALAIYFKDATMENGRIVTPIPAQMKKGLAAAFQKFNRYSLSKWNKDGAIKLKDVLFLVHAKPKDEEQAALWRELVAGTLESPDTWEVALSATKGEGKKEEWERLLKEKKLGAMALLRNLRGMRECNVTESLVIDALSTMKADRVLPFRFISAARYAPQWEQYLEAGMLKCLGEYEKLPGKTAIVVDNSGSMYGMKVSANSEIDRSDAACALAIMIREVCERCVVIGFATQAQVIPARRGFALSQAIKAGPQGGTNTAYALMLAAQEGYDRIIVVTDEQSHQSIGGPLPGSKGYFVNVATYQNGIGYGQWCHIDGWSEAIVDYIRSAEMG